MDDRPGPGASLLGNSLREPPNNIRAEMGLVGALLANNNTREKCGGLLPVHFADPEIGAIYGRVIELIDEGKRVDAVTLKGEFNVVVLASLLSSFPSLIIVGEYAAAIKSAWMARAAIAIGTEFVNQAFGGIPGQNIETVVTETAARLMEITEGATIRVTVDFATAADNVVRRAEAAHKGDGGSGRLDTGIPSIDGLWNGLWPGRLYYLVARSQTGKTAAMLQFCRNIARTLGTGEHVHIFSLEMSAEDLQIVNFAAEGRWTADQINAGHIGGANDWLEFEGVRDTIRSLPMVVDDGRFDFSALAARARSVLKKKKTRLIGVDFMDLVRRGQDQARMGLPEFIPSLTYNFKDLAKELNVPILVLRQITKSRDKAESTEPVRSDLLYDGGEAADDIFALYRREIHMTGEEPPGLSFIREDEKKAQKRWDWERAKKEARGQAKFIALKRRFGQLGAVELHFDGPRMMLREAAPGMPQEEIDMFTRGEV